MLTRTRYSLGILCCLISAPLSAQTPSSPPPETAEPDTGLNDIIVTAQKGARGQSVQKTALAITAVDADTIEQTRAVTVIDVSRLAPNVNFTSSATLPGFANYTIRGIGVSGSTSSIDPAVNVVVDGMVYDFQGATVQDAFDLEGIEILRGPQGILFGRNTTGGAVSLRSRRPTGEFKAATEVTIGNYGRRDFAGSIEGPIVDGKILARVAVLRRERDGYFKDRNGGSFIAAPFNPSGAQPVTAAGDIGNIDNWVVRPSIVIRPTETLDINLLGEYVRMKGNGNPSKVVPGFEGPLRDRFGYTPPSGKFETNQNSTGLTDVEAERLVIETNLDIGVGKITSVTGLRHVDFGFAFEDGAPFVNFELAPGNRIESSQVSQELRFASDFSERINLVIGGYADWHTLDVQERRLLSSLVGAPNATTYIVTNRQGNYRQKAESYAVFANIDYHLTDALIVTAGGRYTYDKKRIRIAPINVCTGPGFTGCPSTFSSLEKDWDNFSPKLAARYEFGAGVMAYGSWTKGFRSGQFNGRATSTAQLGPVDPEKASSFEVGFKSTFLDRRARLNLAAYHTKYDALQLTILNGSLQVLQNAGAATFKGIEAELTLKPVNALELSGSFGYTDAAYDRLDGPLAANLTIAESLRKKLLKAPAYTAFGSATYTAQVSADTDVIARASYSWRSSYFVDVLNTPAARQGAHGLLDLSLGIKKDRYSLTFFGRNITNVLVKDLVNTVVVPIQYGGEPATYGVTLNASF
ncbi:TonB-dependent receptor [Sphingomonas koreensis]|uniref:TonB-dependent receptor n=1 Tax=Sphingomonas koreensis TaxID=93064 RepID=A0A430G1Y7_9SPHN|nr:TonB-dependent receptor [Sphingomonas koreensis]RSY82003.1 TonB-dependent receptor [Sphingomonas koreensis]